MNAFNLNLFHHLNALLARQETVAMITVVRSEGSSPRKVGARMLVRSNGEIIGTIGGGTVEYEAIRRAGEALKAGRNELFRVHLSRDLAMCCGGAMELFIETLQPEPTLLIFGAGHVARELCHIAAPAGFDVVVVDEREEFAVPERFALARRVIHDDPLAALQELPAGPLVFVVVVTHLHRLDEDLLRQLSHRSYGYVGMIGSRAKAVKFKTRLLDRGVSKEWLDQVHMPIGAAIGAITPGEIAVSIAAELIAVRRGVHRGT